MVKKSLLLFLLTMTVAVVSLQLVVHAEVAKEVELEVRGMT